MTTNDKTTNVNHLREIFRAMDADRAQEIREAYYKAVEGLHALAESLEIADAALRENAGGILINEHLIACEAIEAMKASRLGSVL